jgi:poly-gamma-glutamate capsule biosynthesis protein CapA/YwtB (metallophosphatase superfamily)
MPALLADDPGSIGLVRPEDVTPDVRALTLDGLALFGIDRVHTLGDWPLLVAAPAAGPSSFEPASAWTLVAGGDVMLDRDVYRLAVLEGRGADFPWDGGTARITDRFCCGWPGEDIVKGKRTGNEGAVRDLLGGADVALVNLEGPAPDTFAYHPSGFVFTMDPALLDGLDRAGVDVVSLANNHIMNAGAKGVADTVLNLDRIDVLHAGAGRNLAVARRPAVLDVADLRVAVLAYDDIASKHHATRSRAGSAPLRLSVVRADIKAARTDGADVVVVVPHWGREYTDRITSRQDTLAHGLIDAGADLVLGAHSHWAGPLEIIDGRLVVYSMGDLVFDLRHDERTQQGILVELTFVGRRLAQVELHPTLIVEDAQPNVLEPAGGGTALLRAIEKASRRLAD